MPSFTPPFAPSAGNANMETTGGVVHVGLADAVTVMLMVLQVTPFSTTVAKIRFWPTGNDTPLAVAVFVETVASIVPLETPVLVNCVLNVALVMVTGVVPSALVAFTVTSAVVAIIAPSVGVTKLMIVPSLQVPAMLPPPPAPPPALPPPMPPSPPVSFPQRHPASANAVTATINRI
jgi:hypothetical protein